MKPLPPKKPKLNPIHDVTGPVRWPQQEEKLRRRQQQKPVPLPKPDNA